MALEGGASAIDPVELEGARDRGLAVVLDQVVGLLVVEDRPPAGSHRTARELADLPDGADPLLYACLVPVVAVGELDGRVDVRADVDLGLG